ncbi:hypothetical protein FDECE_11701 [Fusarium decemcellulare]|nr:hypothetical protein FDECE_11701 [Fusarium decemcellulare]
MAAARRRGQKTGTKRPSFSMTGSLDDLGGDNRPRQRHRTSIIDSDRFQAPSLSIPSMFMGDNAGLLAEHALDGEDMNFDKPNDEEQYPDIWSFPDGPEFDINEIIPPIDWFNNQLLEGTHIPAENTLPRTHAGMQVVPDETNLERPSLS